MHSKIRELPGKIVPHSIGTEFLKGHLRFLLRQERSSRSKYWQHVDGFYNPDVTRRFDLSHLPPIYVHIMYERQLLQGLTLAIHNYAPASRCVYIFRLM